MRLLVHARLILMLLLPLTLPTAQARELVFLAPTNHSEPLARFERGQLKSGLLKDLGDALARRTGQNARFLLLPSKRVGAALAAGQADLLCYVMPGWIEGDFHWFEALIPDAGLLVAHPKADLPARLGDLRGRRIGTVLGYHYPELETELGSEFARLDARDTGSNLDRLAAGQTDLAFVERSAFLAYQRRHPQAGLKQAWVVREFSAGCALSKLSAQNPDKIRQAFQALRSSGELARLLAPYGL
ncbi:ABC-type amino acid transport substrate-binding protein [Inhella inkyongensis]|uniref:ABC-type amino acid transport substrate-binding protein n=1 Tax=Inhella inkyongensis TaxID=392593 RepID=A0A840S591_9BURK|nr:transporter substrate-binding domain-containing protein [Inhella inkyongensis]MBB5203801.1 ABC-type amino acid transport substrate-binding protein [Inhella inkyongensis]